jgi:hypothetical protein
MPSVLIGPGRDEALAEYTRLEGLSFLVHAIGDNLYPGDLPELVDLEVLDLLGGMVDGETRPIVSGLWSALWPDDPDEGDGPDTPDSDEADRAEARALLVTAALLANMAAHPDRLAEAASVLMAKAYRTLGSAA